MRLSQVSAVVPPSPIRSLVPYAQEAKRKGIHIYHLNIGEPDIETPEAMIAVLKRWPEKYLPYSQSRGEPELLQSLLIYYHSLRFNHIGEQNLQATFGGSEGILWAFLSICNPGDEIIVFDPTYANYISLAAMAKVKLVSVQTYIDDGFHLPEKRLIEKKITPRTRGFLFSSPGNPTGTVFNRAELEMLISIAKHHKLYVLSDEVYREFIYEKKNAHVSALEYIDDYPEGIVLIDSLSKRYNLCGARVGVLLSKNERLMESFLKYAQARLSIGIIDQVVASRLVQTKKSYFRKVVVEYKKRRNTVVSGLSKIAGVTCYRPEGAFYVIAKLPVKSAADFARWMLTDFHDNNETVMVAPLDGFYVSHGLGQDEIRIAYVLNTQALKRSVFILKKALEVYNN